MENSNKLGNPNKNKDKISGSGCFFIAFTIFMLVIALFTCDGCEKEHDATTTSTLADVSTSSRSEETKQSDVPTNRVDQKAVSQLKKYFKFNKDEFEKTTWVKPKDAPKFINRNAIYCYFALDGNIPTNFRFAIQYYADDWLFIQAYKFSLDGIVYDYYPTEIEKDNDSMIWEWSDSNLSATDMSLLNALVTAKSAKIKFIGRQYSKTKAITSKQLLSIKRTYQLYKAMGGSF